MQVFPFEIDYYINKEGKKPFREWLENLKDITARAKIRIRLDRARFGNLGDNRSVGEGVRELRIDYGPVIGSTLLLMAAALSCFCSEVINQGRLKI